MTFRKFHKKSKRDTLVDPDEIFLDSKNPGNFDRQQFEGRIEKAISKKTIYFLGSAFLMVILVFMTRLGYLQIKKGEAYYKRSENNILEKILLFAERGIIYDRHGVELVWNKKDDEEKAFGTRMYLSDGFAHTLGYVSYPAQDNSGRYWQGEFIGKDGLEKEYNDKLKGENGSKIIEVDAYGNVHSENIVNNPKRGDDLVTTLDSRIQKELYLLIKQASEKNKFNGAVGIIMDITNGELIAINSSPEYNSEILSLGKDKKSIDTYLTDRRKILLDRAISGLYTPGSIVKPIFALGALAENVIDEKKQILSTGSISIQNPYFKDQKTIFRDWKAHGWTDMKEALAVSSDVYFYTIGGGYESQRGLGILNLEKYSRLFGIGEKTGVDLPDEKEGTIPNPKWKILNFEGDPWRIGDTYYTAIGQYGFQVTPLEITRAIGAIANKGTLVTPHLILGDDVKKEDTEVINLKKEYFDIIHEGMRQAVTYGTAVALNVPYVKIAAKTGTAQLGLAKDRVNSWIVGFFPYENPRYTFTILMESGPANGNVGASSIMRNLLDWMAINTPEYFE